MAMRSSKDFALIDPEAINSEFCSQHASKSLRVTCYGSSSSKTPMRYLKAAETLGYTLAKRGHICVNGAGSHGCMAAMNDGAVIGNGHIVGVIHEMFVVDAYFGDQKIVERDGGAHEALMKSAFKKDEKGPIREILVAGGSDLQERKKMLVQNADALVVLPGGPGTWDELWEMACCRNLGLVQMPIVCVNVEKYYEPFREMLERAYEDELIKSKPEEIVYFASTVEEAIQWVEIQAENASKEKKKESPSLSECSATWSKAMMFAGGMALGFSIALTAVRR